MCECTQFKVNLFIKSHKSDKEFKSPRKAKQSPAVAKKPEAVQILLPVPAEQLPMVLGCSLWVWWQCCVLGAQLMLLPLPFLVSAVQRVVNEGCCVVFHHIHTSWCPHGVSVASVTSGLLLRQCWSKNTDEKLINPCKRAAIASLQN